MTSGIVLSTLKVIFNYAKIAKCKYIKNKTRWILIRETDTLMYDKCCGIH